MNVPLGKRSSKKSILRHQGLCFFVHLSHKGGLAGEGKPITELVVTRLTSNFISLQY